MRHAITRKPPPATRSDNPSTDVLFDTNPQAQGSSTPTSGFDYAVLAPAEAADLRERAARLRGLVTKSTADMIEIGGDLLAIKERLEHGQFVDWIERELGIGIRSAQGYIAIAKLAKGKSETVSLLPPSTARILAAKSTPPTIVEQIIVRAGAGDLVADVAVKTMIADNKAMWRQAKSAADAAKRKSKEGRAARERKAVVEENRRLADQARARAGCRAMAQSIIDRFSCEDVAFLANTLTWDILDEFKRLVAEVGAP
jgi:hypothetical protein